MKWSALEVGRGAVGRGDRDVDRPGPGRRGDGDGRRGVSGTVHAVPTYRSGIRRLVPVTVTEVLLGVGPLEGLMPADAGGASKVQALASWS